jgi:site-specific DNA-cytosine methylase
MIVLGLFNGISCGQVALERAGVEVDTYYSSEVDKYCIEINQKNYPDTIQLGGIEDWMEWDIDWSSIDLIIGGSPCQGFSLAGKQLAFDDPRSKLFFTMRDIIEYTKLFNPDVKFMLENVKMKSEYMNAISDLLNVEPIFINSALVSAQNRQRYYWCNWDVTVPEDRGVNLCDILEQDLPSCGVGTRIVGRRLNELGIRDDYNKDINITQYMEIRKDNKSNCLTTVYKDSIVPYYKTDKRLIIKFNQNKASCLTGGANSGGNHSDMDVLVIEPDICRRYSPIECERLQTLPDNYTEGVSNTQRYKMLGNAWTVDVISHLFKSIC